MSKFRTLLLIPLILLVCAILGGIYGPKVAATPGDDGDAQIRTDLRSLAQVYSLVATNYAVPVKPDDIIYDGAIPGMLRELDPHSSFFDPKAFARMREDQSGRYYGVGMMVGPRANHTVVIMPFEGTPAYKAGLRPGDIIGAVNGKSTDGLSTDDVAALLKGPKGTAVTISVIRVGHAKPIEFTVIRAEVHHNSVDSYYQIRPGVEYIHLTQFTETSADEIRHIIDSLGGPARVKGVVLDLRSNPGGLLSQAVGIGDMLLAKGQVIVSHHGRSSPERVYTATHGNGGYDYPLVIIVNNFTASAAEIVSGAVQDHDRGLIIGQTTFGKGLVQTVFQLSDDTGLALTTAHYYTPSGRLIQRPYEGVSLYDYYYDHKSDTKPIDQREVKMTDTGRTVYGGGGITPDVILPDPKLSSFQQNLTDRSVFFDFSDYFLGKHESVPRDWNPDQATLNDFAAFLTKQHIPFTPTDISQNADWLKVRIKRQIFTVLYGESVGLRAMMQDDKEVQRAIQLLPQAEALELHARQVDSARQNAGLHPLSHSATRPE